MDTLILIVDDVAMNRKLMRGVLQRSIDTKRIIEAESGIRALELLRTDNVGVVILDIMMPEMDGIEVLSRIKDNPKTSNIPVIMCSAIHELESIEDALSRGALDYFTKPLKEEDMRIMLPLKVKNALEFFEAKRELIHYADHIKEEMKLAEKVQKSMITNHFETDRIEVFGRYEPCEEIGGDMFCMKQQDEKFWFMIADISGHGISSAMTSTMINVIFNTAVSSCNQVDELLAKINRTMFQVFGYHDVILLSAFVGLIEEDQLSYANAGHPYPILIRQRDHKVEGLENKGFLLGMFEDATFEKMTTKMGAEDLLLLYTDGLFDNGKAEAFSNWNAVKFFCKKHISEIELQEGVFLDQMLMEFSSNGEEKFIDDVALMLIAKK
jgi:phosphoserine phosphatase RsbU/P